MLKQLNPLLLSRRQPLLFPLKTCPGKAQRRRTKDLSRRCTPAIDPSIAERDAGKPGATTGRSEIRSRDTPVARAHGRRKNRHSLCLPHLTPRHHKSGVTPYFFAASTSTQSASTSTFGGPNPRMYRSLSEVSTSVSLADRHRGEERHWRFEIGGGRGEEEVPSGQ